MNAGAVNPHSPIGYSFDRDSGFCQVFDEHHIPEEVWEISHLVKILDLSNGKRTSLPKQMPRFSNLIAINCSQNAFTDIPKVLRDCTSLEVAIFNTCHVHTLGDDVLPPRIRAISLTNNQLSSIPSSIRQYQQLEKLTLAGNQLKDLPKTLLDCSNLAMLRVAVNQLRSSPAWLLQHPKLAWFTDSANQYSYSSHSLLQDMSAVQWKTLELGEQIGSSRKSKVYQARLQDGQQVALKIFNNHLSTDGVIEDDIAASLLAGNHTAVIGGIARVLQAPNGQSGLVMPLISADYSSLGNLPTYQSLTRDVFDHKFSASVIMQVARDIASAMLHLSKRGIMHGDIYAHNILTNPQGKSMLGDFGCASIYSPQSQDGYMRERIDVLAYGYLLEDLLTHTTESIEPVVSELKSRCLDGDVATRPSFEEIYACLR